MLKLKTEYCPDPHKIICGHYIDASATEGEDQMGIEFIIENNDPIYRCAKFLQFIEYYPHKDQLTDFYYIHAMIKILPNGGPKIINI